MAFPDDTKLDAARDKGLAISQPWPEPEPLSEPEDAPRPFPIHALGALEGPARDIQAATLCPLGLAGVSVLSAAAFAAQGRFDVRFVKQTSRPMSLFILTIGASGERKSSADAFAQIGVKRHIKALRRAASLGDEGGSIIDHKLDPNILIGTGTVEGIARGFVDGHPSQGLFNDEAGGFLSGHSLKSENRMSGLAALSKFWDGESLPHRIKGQGQNSELVYSQNPRLAVHLLGQRVAIMPLLSDPMAKGQGLLARFLVHEPPSTIGTRLTSFEDWETEALTPRIETFADQVEGHLRLSVPRDLEGAVSRPVLDWTEGASRRLHAYSMEVERSLAPLGAFDGFADVVNKVHEQAARISGTLAMFRNEDVISESTMNDAIELASYFLGEIVRLAKLAPADRDTTGAISLAKFVQGKEGSCTQNDCSHNGPKSTRPAKKRKAAVAVLEQAGWLRTIDGVFHLNPKVTELKLLS